MIEAVQKKENKTPIFQQPIVTLIYLIFLFLPWLLKAPNQMELLVTIGSALIYIPLHFKSHSAPAEHKYWYMIAVIVLGGIAAPFWNGHNVYFIYGAAMAGFILDRRNAGIAMVLVIAAYVITALVAGRFIYEIPMTIVIAIMVWLSCLRDSHENERYEQAERERALEKQLASIAERERIAADLHDVIGQTLTLVALKSDLVAKLIDKDAERAKREIQELQSASRDALTQVRSTLRGLTETTIAVELSLARKVLEASNIVLTIGGQVPELSRQQNTVLGLVIREACTNIVRHSGADKVSIVFETEDDVHTLFIEDNGSGIQESNVSSNGVGLTSIRKRISSLGGLLTIQGNKGTVLRGVIPA